MKTRALRAAAVVCLVALMFAAGCAQPPAEPPTTPEPTAVPPSPGEGQSGDAGVAGGAIGTPTTFGSWTVTVRQMEFGSGNDDVIVEPGKTRLKVEVDLKNSSGGALSVAASDWAVVDADGASYAVLPSSRPDKQGERAIPAGATEDVSINFAVPSASGSFTLRFAPTQGSTGALDVPLTQGSTGGTDDKSQGDDSGSADDKGGADDAPGYSY